MECRKILSVNVSINQVLRSRIPSIGRIGNRVRECWTTITDRCSTRFSTKDEALPEPVELRFTRPNTSRELFAIGHNRIVEFWVAVPLHVHPVDFFLRVRFLFGQGKDFLLKFFLFALFGSQQFGLLFKLLTEILRLQFYLFRFLDYGLVCVLCEPVGKRRGTSRILLEVVFESLNDFRHWRL